MGPFGEVITAMITPFDGNGEVDYGQAWKLAEYLVDHGSDGLVIAGTTGESPTLSSEEKVALFRTAVEAVGDKAHRSSPAPAPTTPRCRLELTQRAAEVGVHAVLAVTPYYSKPPQRALVEHFTAMADASDLPVMLYNIPGRTARLIEIETLARLCQASQDCRGQGRSRGLGLHRPHQGSLRRHARHLLGCRRLHPANGGGRRRGRGVRRLAPGRYPDPAHAGAGAIGRPRWRRQAAPVAVAPVRLAVRRAQSDSAQGGYERAVGSGGGAPASAGSGPAGNRLRL